MLKQRIDQLKYQGEYLSINGGFDGGRWLKADLEISSF
jgi:hypothetical protein